MKTILTVFVLIVFALINVGQVYSQDDQTLEKMAADEELEQEMKWLKAETYVITASKVKENIKKTPASIKRPPAKSQSSQSGSRVEIMTFETTNSLVILAPPGIYREMVKTIKKLDVYPREVLIEAA